MSALPTAFSVLVRRSLRLQTNLCPRLSGPISISGVQHCISTLLALQVSVKGYVIFIVIFNSIDYQIRPILLIKKC